MYSKEADLLKKISEARKAIRLKHLQLKNHTFQVDDNINKIFKPIITPLNKIASLKNISNSSSSEISNIPKSEQSIMLIRSLCTIHLDYCAAVYSSLDLRTLSPARVAGFFGLLCGCLDSPLCPQLDGLLVFCAPAIGGNTLHSFSCSKF